MGKIYNKTAIDIVAVMLAIVVLLGFREAYAIYREAELFDLGYEHYLSSQPEKAVEAFSVFLREFPQSSAKDAAMFWTAKSLIEMRNVQEAKNMFDRMTREFPESPLKPHAIREIEELGETDAEKERGSSLRGETYEGEESHIEVRQRQEKRGVREVPLSRKGQREANEHEETSGQTLGMHGRYAVKSEAREPVLTGKDEGAAIIIEDSPYTIQQVSAFMNNSFAAIHRLAIREIIWRTGNVYEDFINEQILYEEARRSGVMDGEAEREKAREKYMLSPEEDDYLQRYLAISLLVDKKLREGPEERVAESLSVRYTDGDRREKELLASELQGYAKIGKPFSEIRALYPQKVSYTVVVFEELEEWIKNEIRLLQNGEISVFWSNEGYTILKPAIRKLSFEAFEDMDPGRRTTASALVKEYIAELRKERGKIEVVRDDNSKP